MTGTLTLVAPSGGRVTIDLAALRSRDRAREETSQWIKRLRAVREGDRSMRQRFTYRGDSLWWFTEIYLHKMRRLEAAVGTLVAIDAAVAAHAPARIVVQSVDPAVHEAARVFGARRRLAIEHGDEPARPRNVAHRWKSYLVGVSAALSRARPHLAAPRARRVTVAAFVHTAFWNASAPVDGPAQERYIGPVLDAVAARAPAGGLACVGVGPRRNFRTRKWWDPIAPPDVGRPLVTPIERLAPRSALGASHELWSRRDALAAEIVRGPAIRAAAFVLDCDLWNVLRPELEGAARLQWPWSARAMDEAGAAIDRLEPGVVVTYAEAGGWGRALVLEARRRGVPSVGLQHGFIYRHWLNYRHEPDEMEHDGADRGFPRPDRTLVYDGYAASTLESTGHFPAAAIAITGSPTLDALAARFRACDTAARETFRHALGVPSEGRLLVLAAKFTEIAGELPALFSAVAARPSLRLVVKPHPAEHADVYAPLAAGCPNVSIAPVDADLARLLHAADGLVTMNSTVAIDALVLGVPALVLGLPNNLSPFVDAGVMAGASDGDVGPALDALLYDQRAREVMTARAVAFTHRYGMRADGHAAERAAAEILALVRRD